jgi:hypothetical protein
MPLLELMVPPTVVGADAIGQSSLLNRTIRFAQFQIGVFDSYLFNANKMIHSYPANTIHESHTKTASMFSTTKKQA